MLCILPGEWQSLDTRQLFFPSRKIKGSGSLKKKLVMLPLSNRQICFQDKRDRAGIYGIPLREYGFYVLDGMTLSTA